MQELVFEKQLSVEKESSYYYLTISGNSTSRSHFTIREEDLQEISSLLHNYFRAKKTV